MARSDLMARALRKVVPGWGETKQPTALEKKSVLGAYYEALHAAGLPVGRRGRWTFDRAVAEGYERSLWCFKSVDTISGHASANPFVVKQGEKTIDHPLSRLLNGRANPLESGPQLRERLSSQVLLSPRGAFVELTLSRAGTPVRADLLPPGRTRPVPGDGDELISHYELLHADGTRREIEPERVRWFRKVHPGDAYRGMTPLEAAGYSIEMEHFARVYNLNFLRRDGRPAGIVGIEGEMSPDEMDRIEDRFSGGPMSAGEIAVITGDLSFVDLAKTPRDAAYQVTTRTAKEEVLTAFGVGESVIGNSSGRTFDNAAQEIYSFWTITMPPHLRIITTGWDDDTSDDLVCEIDLSGVEALARIKAEQITQAREDVKDGLITPDEYREIAGKDPFDVLETRCLYLPAGKTRVATSEKDRLELEKREQAAQATPPAPETAPPGREIEPRREQPAVEPPKPRAALAAGQPPPPRQEREEAPGRGTPPEERKDRPRPVLRVLHTKQPLRDPQVVRESLPDETEIGRVEQRLDAALGALSVRWVERTAARLTSPKRRAGTRHWEAAGPDDTRAGDAPLDVEGAVDAATWRAEALSAVEPILEEAARAAARALLADLTDGRAVKDVTGRGVRDVVARVAALVADSAQERARALVDAVRAQDARGVPIGDLVLGARAQASGLAKWARAVAVRAAGAVVLGSRDAAAGQITGADITRMWLSRRDTIVRPSHVKADRQVRAVGEPFQVGAALLDWPCDPDGPPEETYNCRCRLLHRSVATGQFVAAPVQTKLSSGGQHVPGTPYEWRHGWIPLTPRVAERWKKPWPPGGPDSGLVPEARRGSDRGDAPSKPRQEKPPGPLDGIDLPDLDDEEIADLFGKHADDMDVADQLMNEMQRRDDADRDAARRGGYDADAGDTENDRQIAILVGKGRSYKDAYAQVYDLNPDDLDREERRMEADQRRLPGESIDQTVRRMYDEWVHLQWLEAENATNGYLTRRGSNVDPISLFSGPAHVARAHASKELLRWWDENPRQTYQEFKAEILVRSGDVAGARASREGRSGREHGV